MAATCDIVIVGGGVLGVSMAFHLAQRKAGRIILLEKSHLGAGASGKELAQARLFNEHLPTAALCRHSLRAYERFADEVGGPRVLVRTGAVVIAAESERAALQASADALTRDLAISLAPLGSLELLELDPNAHLADSELALLDAEAGLVDGVQVIASYADAARGLGVEICQGVEVQRIVGNKGKASGVETNEGAYECEIVVLATGAWSPALVRALAVDLPVQPCRSQMALFRRPLDSGRRGVIIADRVQGLAIFPGPDYYLRAGELGPDALEKDADTENFNESADSDWLAGLRQRLSRRCPVMHRAYGRGGYGALCDLTPDGRPILDRLPVLDNVIVAAGFGGRAVELAPATGQLAADLVVPGTSAELDLAPFRLERFAAPAPA